LECEEDLCVCVSLCLYFSCEKNPKHWKVQKLQKRVKTSLSLSLAILLIFFTKPRTSWRQKLNEQAGQG
jgi:hypothetical protein